VSWTGHERKVLAGIGGDTAKFPLWPKYPAPGREGRNDLIKKGSCWSSDQNCKNKKTKVVSPCDLDGL
jgi:hypothetical protein